MWFIGKTAANPMLLLIIKISQKNPITAVEYFILEPAYLCIFINIVTEIV